MLVIDSGKDSSEEEELVDIPDRSSSSGNFIRYRDY